ncbi:hypothetical protein L1887_35855 [Cichorium endivia]|nr:hypothetical protein L1887_35855 [Cichorium endivia]
MEMSCRNVELTLKLTTNIKIKQQKSKEASLTEYQRTEIEIEKTRTYNNQKSKLAADLKIWCFKFSIHKRVPPWTQKIGAAEPPSPDIRARRCHMAQCLSASMAASHFLFCRELKGLTFSHSTCVDEAAISSNLHVLKHLMSMIFRSQGSKTVTGRDQGRNGTTEGVMVQKQGFEVNESSEIRSALDLNAKIDKALFSRVEERFNAATVRV